MIPQFSPADRFREIEKEAFPIPESFKSHAFMSSDLYNQAIVQVGQYWRSLFHEDQGPTSEEAYGPENRKPAWFGDLVAWLEPIRVRQVQKNSNTKRAVQRQDFPCPFILPASISEYLTMIAIELNTLLPENNPLVKAVLPVLIYSYCLNRKSQGEPELDDNGYPIDEASLQGTSKLYVDLKTNLWDGYTAPRKGKDPLFKRASDLFALKDWLSEYPKLTLSSMQNKQKDTQLQRILGKILLFITLTYRLRDICNVTMSMDAFETLTGYLSMISVNLPMYEQTSERPFPRASDPFKQKLVQLLQERQIENLDSGDTLLLYYRFQYLFRYMLWYREHGNENRDPTEKEMELITAGIPGLDLVIEGEGRASQRTHFQQPPQWQ